MTKLTVELTELEYQCLKKTAEKYGKSAQILIHEWISRLPEAGASLDKPFYPDNKPEEAEEDPIFQLGKSPVSDNVTDASVNHDLYIYGK